ncbi:FxsA family protein [Oryzomonas japonica]|uniref:FxsA family protein n=1 Tax=Oryzomonas japonica TaxID=2603858 RepID=A0A7J4ZV55_9BACT|nr:FxsA family protein [Oryzomonas japonica]KAB0667508.1 FxsA family protein [Oryzomonas japonica]
MLLRLFLIFTIVPIIEVWLLIKIGRVIGALPTVAVLLAISLAGAWLARSQGFRVVAAIRDELAAGRMPGAQILDGALILTGGILLLTPGFFTDFIGLFFLIPATRTLLKRWLGIWLERRLRQGSFVVRRF